MDFESATAAVNEWLSKACKLFLLSSVVEEDKKMVFSCSGKNSGSFYMIVQQDGDRNKWHVWSDDDSILQLLNPVIEYLSEEDCKPLEEVLQHIKSSLDQDEVKCTDEDDKINDEDGEEDEEEEEEDDFDDYYMNDDIDADDTELRKSEEKEDFGAFSSSAGNSPAVKRLTSDLKMLQKAGDLGFEAHPYGDELFHWSVKLKDFPKDSPLAKDLKKYATLHHTEPVIEMDMQFPQDYPYAPPFLRVIRPRIKFLTGHVTVGGSICMEMLTRSGWRPTNDIESLLVTVRSEIMSDPNTRLDPSRQDVPYSELEAKDAFDRMVKRYHWN